MVDLLDVSVITHLASLKEYKRTYEHILESEKKLDTARKQLVLLLYQVHHSSL